MKKQFTEDGKCLACELMAKGVNPERLRHKVYHVCILRQYAVTAKQEAFDEAEQKKKSSKRIIKQLDGLDQDNEVFEASMGYRMAPNVSFEEVLARELSAYDKLLKNNFKFQSAYNNLSKDGVAKLEARIKELEEENQKLNIELDHCINQSGG